MSQKLQSNAQAIGSVSILWGHLENMTNHFVGILLKIEPGEVVETLTHNMDFREKLDVILGLGYLHKIDDEWFNCLKSSVDKINNDLRIRRNRIIHDQWVIEFSDVTKIQRRTGFNKAQAFCINYFTSRTETKTDDDVWLLFEDIAHIINDIAALMLGMEGLDWKFFYGRLMLHSPDLRETL